MKRFFVFAAMAATCLAASAQNLKFAHVDYQEVMLVMPEYMQAMDVMSAAQNEAQETFQGMMDEYQAKVAAYEKNAATWSTTIRETKEKELGDIQNRLQEFQQSVQAELQQQQQQLMAPISKKASDAVTAVAKEGNYIYVFDKNSALYVDDSQSDDITMAVRKALGVPDDRTVESVQAEMQAKAAAQQQN